MAALMIISNTVQKGEKKGEFPVTQMKIIEKVPDSTFQKTFCFQVGSVCMESTVASMFNISVY